MVNSPILLAFAQTKPCKPAAQGQQTAGPTSQLAISTAGSDTTNDDAEGPEQPTALTTPKAKGKRVVQQTSTIQSRKIITKWMIKWVEQNGGDEKG
jgi:hypothetical protein